MFLIIGLGNPGDKYANTRHNIGFRAIFSLAKEHKIQATTYKFKSIIGKGRIADEKVILAQPQTYMNNSGEAVKLLVDYYNIPRNKIIIIYDDLDLPTGKIRIKTGGSSGGHRGLQSVIAALETQDIPRIRVGIDRPPEGIMVIDYVLGYFADDEEKLIEKAINNTVEAVESIITDGFQVAMNKFN